VRQEAGPHAQEHRCKAYCAQVSRSLLSPDQTWLGANVVCGVPSLRGKRCQQVRGQAANLLIGELESAPMVTECLARTERPEFLHRVCRVHVPARHEPPGLISADRQQREPEWPVPLGDARELRTIVGPRVPSAEEAIA
jgi:hypothetical protein